MCLSYWAGECDLSIPKTPPLSFSLRFLLRRPLPLIPFRISAPTLLLSAPSCLFSSIAPLHCTKQLLCLLSELEGSLRVAPVLCNVVTTGHRYGRVRKCLIVSHFEHAEMR